MKLFIKPACPWCVDAIEWLKIRGYQFETIDVLKDRNAYDYMISISGQRKTPTLELPDGKVLADFDTDQLFRFFTKHGIKPKKAHSHERD